MLNVLNLIVIVWANLSMYANSIKMSELRAADRYKPTKTVRAQTIAIWMWRDLWISGLMAGLVVILAGFRLFFHSRTLVILAWLLAFAFVVVHVSLSRHVKFLMKQDRNFWKDKVMPAGTLK